MRPIPATSSSCFVTGWGPSQPPPQAVSSWDEAHPRHLLKLCCHGMRPIPATYSSCVVTGWGPSRPPPQAVLSQDEAHPSHHPQAVLSRDEAHASHLLRPCCHRMRPIPGTSSSCVVTGWGPSQAPSSGRVVAGWGPSQALPFTFRHGLVIA